MLSAVLLTKNEEKKLPKCLKALKFCDEVIMIDDNSTDNTISIARKFGAKIYRRDMNLDFATQSNYGIKKAKGDWTLLVDADEIVSPELASEILSMCHPALDAGSRARFSAFSFPRHDYFMGRLLKYGETGNSRVTRLVKKGKGEWSRRVHPNLKVDGKVSELNSPILHYPHEKINEFVKSVNRWSEWHALALKEEGKKSLLLKVFLWPPLKFINNYLYKGGFNDGTPGFIHATLMSLHSFLAWSILYVNNNKQTT